MAFKNTSLKKTFKTLAVVAASILGSLVLAGGLTYGFCLLKRPARTPQVRSLFQGITYERYSRNTPRPLVFHVVTVDLTAPGIEFLATPQGIADDGKETTADTVPGFLQKQGVQVAINANFFYPMHVHHPFDYAPHVGEGVNAVGIMMSNGNRYSEAEADWPALCIASAQEISIADSGDCPDGTAHGWAGDRYFLKEAQLVAGSNYNELFPRTVVALDEAHEAMWLVTVDGRQKGYSEGITLAELAEELIALGASKALNLDGGGSSTLAVDSGGRAKVLNSPFQARIPTNLRPVANHLGIYANPMPED